MNSALVNQHLKRLGARFGIENLQLDEQGIAALEVRDILLVFRHDDQQGLTTVNAQLSSEPVPNVETFALRLLQAQELGIDTGGCFFSIDSNQLLWLSYAIFLRFLSYDNFSAIVEQVFTYAVAWRSVVRDWMYESKPA